MRSASGAGQIGIVVYPGVQLAAVHGLTDLFAIAARVNRDAGRTSLSVSHWEAGGRTAQNVKCIYRSSDEADPRPDVLIVPPTLNALPDADVLAGIAQWLLARHSDGVLIVSLCSGAFLVAETGLLDERIVSSHWSCAQALMEMYPRVVVRADERLIEHAGLLTAGGFMAWLEVGLILVERFIGERAREETARFLTSGGDLMSPAQQPKAFVPPIHKDQPILRAQELVHIRDGRDLALPEMAAVARLERRTFIRRFTIATGMTPMTYCRAVRMARGRELLEASSLSLTEIADLLCYREATSFTRAFREAYGQTPAQFRKQARVAMGQD